LKMVVNLPYPSTEDRPPRFIDNLKNLSNSTSITLNCGRSLMHFSGPNGVTWMDTRTAEVQLMLKSLVHFDTSKTERLGIIHTSSPDRDLLHQVLLPMKDLRTLTLKQTGNPHVSVRVLHPGMSPLGAVVCPKLEELVIKHLRELDIREVVGMAAARSSRGAKLKLIKTSWDKASSYSESDILELQKYILRVECSPTDDGGSDDSYDGCSDAEED